MPVTVEETAILVMERGNEDVKLVTSLLEKTGFHVSQSADRAEVLRYCRAAQDVTPLLIIDTATPGLQISELLDQVQAANSSVRVLMITAPDESEDSWSGKRSVRGHLTRPFRRAQFLGCVLEAAKTPLVFTA
jgi:DNA-binding response OmpR family regulator